MIKKLNIKAMRGKVDIWWTSQRLNDIGWDHSNVLNIEDHPGAADDESERLFRYNTRV